MSKLENRKMLSTRVPEELIDELTHYRKVNPTGELSQVDYVIKAIEEKNERVKHLRDGGRYIKYFRIPIENRNVDIEKVQQARDVLIESVRKMMALGDIHISSSVMDLVRLIDRDLNMNDLEIRKISDRNLEDINFETENYYKYNSSNTDSAE